VRSSLVQLDREDVGPPSDRHPCKCVVAKAFRERVVECSKWTVPV
jgi:hypothetical protein